MGLSRGRSLTGCEKAATPKRDNVQEEDAELVLTLMGEHSSDVLDFLPTLIQEFPNLAKRIYHFSKYVKDKEEVASLLLDSVRRGEQVTEYQLFWFARMAEDYLLKTPQAADLLNALFEHPAATAITKAKVLEIPTKRFGCPS